MFAYRMCTTTPKSLDAPSSTTSTTSALGFEKFLYDPCTTTIAKFNYGCRVRLPLTLEDFVDVKFLAVTSNIYGMCTTTKWVPLPLPKTRVTEPSSLTTVM